MNYSYKYTLRSGNEKALSRHFSLKIPLGGAGHGSQGVVLYDLSEAVQRHLDGHHIAETVPQIVAAVADVPGRSSVTVDRAQARKRGIDTFTQRLQGEQLLRVAQGLNPSPPKADQPCTGHRPSPAPEGRLGRAARSPDGWPPRGHPHRGQRAVS